MEVTWGAMLVLLSFTADAEAGVARTVEPRPLMVVLVGGFISDPSPDQVNDNAGRGGNSGMYRLYRDLQEADGISAEYFNWNGTRAGNIRMRKPPMAPGIAEFIRERRSEHPDERLVVIGNSWGGHTALEVCEQLATAPTMPVERLMFLDPSSLGRTVNGKRPGELPENVQHAVNYFTRHKLSWRSWTDEARVENIDLGDPKNGYLVEKGPRYDSPIDFKAHVAAEWDDRIHLDIRRRILTLRESAAVVESVPAGTARVIRD